MRRSGLAALQVRLRLAARRYRVVRYAREVWAYAQEPIGIFAIIYVIAAFCLQPFYVPSGSMQPTLGIGDLLIASKFSYGYTRYSLPFSAGPTPHQQILADMPEPGDVVVFRKPGQEAATLVKRVVALPGDRVQMKAGRLWINGQALALRLDGTGLAQDGPGEHAPGKYFAYDRFIETLPNGREHPIFKKMLDAPLDDTPEYLVPPGHVFVMGDNRDDSADSRISVAEGGVGLLPVPHIVGRARVVLTSVDFVNARGVWEWPLHIRLARTLERIR